MKHINWDLIRELFGAKTLDSHLSQPILFYKEILKLTTVTYTAVTDNVFEVKK
jgi:hypothetical protein